MLLMDGRQVLPLSPHVYEQLEQTRNLKLNDTTFNVISLYLTPRKTSDMLYRAGNRAEWESRVCL